MKKFLNCCLITLCYWQILFIGPAIVLLWNNFSYYVAGTGYGSESFMYKLLTFLSQPIACFAAAGLAGSLFGGKHKLCTLVNCVVGACLCSVIAIFNFYLSQNATLVGALAVSSIACIITAASLSKGIVYIDEQASLEKHKSIQAELNDSNNAARILNLISKKTGRTATDIAETLYISFRKAVGVSEDFAREELEKEKQNWH
jgi:hypothetical protein